jgi:acyl-CoA thioesterase FadM
MILNGFISHFVGVHFPGGHSVLHSVSTQFKSPCHLGDEIVIEATVTQVVQSMKVLVMNLVLTNVTRGRVAAKSKVQMGLL